MHAGSAQMMGMASSFWPLAYSLKSYDMSLHPAFLPSAYRLLPTSPYTPTSPIHANGQTNNSPPPTANTKSEKFTIDAILNKDKSSGSSSGDTNSRVPSPDDLHKSFVTDYRLSEKDADDLLHRRHQRFLEASHPYLSHHAGLSVSAEKSYLQKHLPTAYKQFTESSRQDKADKKSSHQLGDSWSKPSKGKRVRTIFTPEQLERMEAEFERQQYMVGTERYYLANSLNLTEAQVKVWFQNRRIKWRKQHLEQQQAKLKQIDIFRTGAGESASDDDSDDDIASRDPRDPRDHPRDHDDTASPHDLSSSASHVDILTDPFQSPKEMRGTQ